VFPFSIDFTGVSSLGHCFDRSPELFAAIDEFQRQEGNVALALLEAALDRAFAAARPRLVGNSITYAHQFFLGILLARLVPERFPEVFLVLGGPMVATLANRGRKLGSFALFEDIDAVSVS